MSDDMDAIVVSDHAKQSLLAKRRRAESAFRNPTNSIKADRTHYRATCPWCQAENVVMSQIDPSQPMSIAPNKGDCLKCDACRQMHMITQINLDGQLKSEPFRQGL